MIAEMKNSIDGLRNKVWVIPQKINPKDKLGKKKGI